MKKLFILAMAIQLSIFLILTACSGKKPTNRVDDEEPSLIGTWDLLAVKIDGETVDPDSQIDLPVKMILNSDGTGQVWLEDYGRLEGSSPRDLLWHTSGDQFVVQLEDEPDEGRATYTLTENVLSLLFPDGEQYSLEGSS